VRIVGSFLAYQLTVRVLYVLVLASGYVRRRCGTAGHGPRVADDVRAFFEDFKRSASARPAVARSQNETPTQFLGWPIFT